MFDLCNNCVRTPYVSRRQFLEIQTGFLTVRGGNQIIQSIFSNQLFAGQTMQDTGHKVRAWFSPGKTVIPPGARPSSPGRETVIPRLVRGT